MKIVLSRDVVWLNKLYAEHMKIKRLKEIVIEDDEMSDQEGTEENVNEDEGASEKKIMLLTENFGCIFNKIFSEKVNKFGYLCYRNIRAT